ncbi:MAG: D-glycero-beta-D-manno-heptose 1,7-bisphosphate 7-phosphatase [Pseudomonadota bacterium]
MKTLLLDRDGVINQDSEDFVKSAEEWHPIIGSLEAMARACQKGYRVIVISNQSGVARGILSIHDLNEINREMQRRASAVGAVIDAVFFCPHAPNDDCSCRKPRPGLFDSLARRIGSLAGSLYVGDRMSDVDAARAAGVKPALVQTGLRDIDASDCADVAVFPNLSAAIDNYLS